MKPKLITNKLIANLKPCKDRHDNYLKYYKGKSYTKAQFMGLKNITHDDKVWVSFRLVPKDSLRFIAADIAESVLDLYEKLYPNDNRPRKAIEAARSNSMSLKEKKQAYNAAAAAASAAYPRVYATNFNTAAYFAADVAYFAVYTAICADTVTNVAATADTAVYAAAYAASSDNRKTQEKLIRKIILKYWK